MTTTIHTEYHRSGAIGVIRFGISASIILDHDGARAVLQALADCAARPILSDETGSKYVLRFDGNGVTFDGGINGTFRVNDIDGLQDAAINVIGPIAA